MTLGWFWDQQASPGLYTWWEGRSEENASAGWQLHRGWVAPPHVTPHYWAAAEMLMLQIDMLAHIDLARGEPTLVIGGGVPAAWLSEEIEVRGLATRYNDIDWTWRDGTVRVSVRGASLPIRLGDSFPKDTQLLEESSTRARSQPAGDDFTH